MTLRLLPIKVWRYSRADSIIGITKEPGMRRCELEDPRDLPSTSLDTPLHCGSCGEAIPASSALSFEGEDYLRYFCGTGCLADWCHRVSDTVSGKRPG